MVLERAKGVRDFLPASKMARDKVVANLRDVFELYGYNPLETPVIEKYELFASKYGQGENSEAMKEEAFIFEDRGDRKLILRTEFTVPFARVIGMNKKIKMPFKRYQMGPVFRDGPLKPGRYREFWQCDVDVVGASVGAIDAEMIDMAQKVFKNFGLEVEVRINNRKLLNSILDKVGVKEEDKKDIIISIDKMDKVGMSGVAEELKFKKVDTKIISGLVEIFDISGNNQEKIKGLRKILSDQEGLNEIELVLGYLADEKNVVFMPSLARGLEYYTGSIFEVFLQERSKISSSVAGGGRYDKMIGGFLEDGKEYPAVGISFGLETILDALGFSEKEGEDGMKTIAEYFIIPMGKESVKESLKILKMLRDNGMKADFDYLERKNFSKALDYANGLGIPYVIILGENEIKGGFVMVKDMKKGVQKKVEISQLLENLKKRN